MSQQEMFYEDAYDAIDKGIISSGKNKKELAAIVYPGRKPETAASLLSRALTPENTDVNLNLENLLTILRETRPEDFIFYLCDEFGFERPSKRNKDTFEKEIKSQLQTIQEMMIKAVKDIERHNK